MEFTPFILVSIVFIAFGIALGFFSPKKKIWWYGYRTPQSMKSNESYILANRISGRIMIIHGLLIFISSVFFETLFTKAIIIIGIVSMLAFTEWKLYQFHKNKD
jgi:uncharacterized membrane protein